MKFSWLGGTIVVPFLVSLGCFYVFPYNRGNFENMFLHLLLMGHIKQSLRSVFEKKLKWGEASKCLWSFSVSEEEVLVPPQPHLPLSEASSSPFGWSVWPGHPSRDGRRISSGISPATDEADQPWDGSQKVYIGQLRYSLLLGLWHSQGWWGYTCYPSLTSAKTRQGPCQSVQSEHLRREVE